MTLHEQIKEEIKNAMRAKDALRLEVLRGISTAFTNTVVAERRPPTELIDDKGAIAVLKRLVKQRKDAIEQFTNGGRADLAEKEASELPIIEAFLPAMMSEAEIEVIAKEVLSEMGTIDKSKLGQITGAIMKRCGGNADGNVVKSIIEKLVG